MAVMMGLRMSVDPARFEQVVNADPDRVTRIAEKGRQAGAIHHRFYANDDGGEVLVVDEWPDAESFLKFFESTQEEIGPLMAEAGMTERPQPVFWRELDTPDKF
jgi:heme-degrading monooxygenase HmoA